MDKVRSARIGPCAPVRRATTSDRVPPHGTPPSRTLPSTELRTTSTSGCTSRTADVAIGPGETAPKAPALVASYRKTLFLYEPEKRGGTVRRSRHTGRPPRLNRHETDKVKLTGGHHFGHYEKRPALHIAGRTRAPRGWTGLHGCVRNAPFVRSGRTSIGRGEISPLLLILVNRRTPHGGPADQRDVAVVSGRVLRVGRRPRQRSEYCWWPLSEGPTRLSKAGFCRDELAR